jgi:hypothetical protein
MKKRNLAILIGAAVVMASLIGFSINGFSKLNHENRSQEPNAMIEVIKNR